MTKKSKLDIPINVLVTVPIKTALQTVARENNISVSDIVRAAINAAVPFMYPKYPTYLTEASKSIESEGLKERV